MANAASNIPVSRRVRDAMLRPVANVLTKFADALERSSEEYKGDPYVPLMSGETRPPSRDSFGLTTDKKPDLER